MFRHFAVSNAHGQPAPKGRDGRAISARITEAEAAPEAIAAEVSREVGVVLGEVVVGANGNRGEFLCKGDFPCECRRE